MPFRTSAIISLRCSGVSLAFLALPPRLPSATAALFFIGEWVSVCIILGGAVAFVLSNL